MRGEFTRYAIDGIENENAGLRSSQTKALNLTLRAAKGRMTVGYSTVMLMTALLGPTITVSTAALLVAEPAALVATTV